MRMVEHHPHGPLPHFARVTPVCSWLQSLKRWSLRQSRRGSQRPQVKSFHLGALLLAAGLGYPPCGLCLQAGQNTNTFRPYVAA